MKEILSIDEITEDLRRTNKGGNIKEEEGVNNDDISQSIMEEMVSRIHERKESDLNIGTIKDSGNFRSVHLWYSDNYWSDKYYSFHIHIPKSCTEQKVEIEVRFGMNYKKLNLSDSMRISKMEKLTGIADENNMK